MLIYDHQRVIWFRTQATDSQIGALLKQRDDALAKQRRLQEALDEAEARAAGNFRLYELTEKYHNEDMLLMQEMENVIAAAARVVSGPDSENYARLSEAIDAYEQAKRERDRTY